MECALLKVRNYFVNTECCIVLCSLHQSVDIILCLSALLYYTGEVHIYVGLHVWVLFLPSRKNSWPTHMQYTVY
jgi:hypothetical protein